MEPYIFYCVFLNFIVYHRPFSVLPLEAAAHSMTEMVKSCVLCKKKKKKKKMFEIVFIFVSIPMKINLAIAFFKVFVITFVFDFNFFFNFHFKFFQEIFILKKLFLGKQHLHETTEIFFLAQFCKFLLNS